MIVFATLLQKRHRPAGISEAHVLHHQHHFSPLSPAHLPPPMRPMVALPLTPSPHLSNGGAFLFLI